MELGEEIYPDKMAMVILGSGEDIGNKVVSGNEPASMEDILNVKD